VCPPASTAQEASALNRTLRTTTLLPTISADNVLCTRGSLLHADVTLGS
jgi:hypothetical protein